MVIILMLCLYIYTTIPDSISLFIRAELNPFHDTRGNLILHQRNHIAIARRRIVRQRLFHGPCRAVDHCADVAEHYPPVNNH